MLCSSYDSKNVSFKVFRDLKVAGLRNVNKLLSKRQFCSTFDNPYHRDIPHYFSQNKGVILKMDSSIL